MDNDIKLLSGYISRHTLEALLHVEKLEIDVIVSLVDSITPDSAVILLSLMDRYKAARVFENLEYGKAIFLMELLPVEVTVNLLSQIRDELCKSYLEGIPENRSKEIALILKYPENTVGAYLSSTVFTLPIDINAKDGFQRIKESKIAVQQYIFILERDHKLSGVINLHDLLTADPEKSIRSIMNNTPPKILADRNIESLLKENEWSDPYPSLAVVDINGIFLGILSRESLSKIHLKEIKTDTHAIEAGNALGDLFRIGISGIFRGALEMTTQPKPK